MTYIYIINESALFNSIEGVTPLEKIGKFSKYVSPVHIFPSSCLALIPTLLLPSLKDV